MKTLLLLPLSFALLALPTAPSVGTAPRGDHDWTVDGGHSSVVFRVKHANASWFQGMFDKNTLTFNPGWNAMKETLKEFHDVRDLQRTLKARGLTPAPAADESTDGPAYFMLTDPDGNPILVDQHVPKPKR